jgi:polysaccharide export outer membrane protein
VIQITVSSHEGHDQVVPIQPDGRIQIPLAGEVLAAGLTPAQVAARLQELLNVELIDPRVTVSLKESRREATERVTLLGAVRSAGVFPLKGRGTLAEMLATAGGPTPDADLSRITITRADRSVQMVDFSQVRQTGRVDVDVPLQPGDMIVVPTGTPPTIAVQVLGQVARAGNLEVPRESHVMDVITQAGGPTPQADLSRLRLTRAGETRILNLLSGAADGAASPTQNLQLQAGGLLLVPENEDRVYVLGAVAKADAYPLRKGDRVFDVLTRSGGAAPTADVAKCLLIRRNEQNQPVAQRLDLKRMLTRGDMKNNLPLRPGDVILIPGKQTRGSSFSLSNLVSPFVSLFGLLRYGF